MSPGLGAFARSTAMLAMAGSSLLFAATGRAQEASPTAATPTAGMSTPTTGMATPVDGLATPMSGMASPVAADLTVPLLDADGAEAGTAMFTQEADGVRLQIEMSGLTPGEHGWHLHAMGMCDASGLEAFSTAGPHWDPTGAPHAGPDDPVHHAGDFGNLTADADGNATAEITLSTYTLDPGPTSVADADGTALIVHTGEDDLVSQPSGNSGARYACGIVAEPQSMEMSAAMASAETNTTIPAHAPFDPSLVENLSVPDGFTVEVYASGLTNPRLLAYSPNGTLYVTETSANTVRALYDTDGDGAIDEAVPVAVNLPYVHGIVFHEDGVFLAGEKRIWHADVAEDGSFTNLKLITEDLPDGDQHGRHTLAIGPDNQLYVSIGSSCNACMETDKRNATIMRMNLDGSDPVIVASGLRNTIGWAWHPETGELWGMDQGSDARGDDQPPEELNQIIEGGNYGWPYCFGDQEVDSFLSYPPPGATRDQYCENTMAPVLTYQAHSSPIAFAFYQGQQFPAEYQGNAFVTMRGSWNRGEPTGYKVVRLQFENGQPTGFEDFATGWLMPDGQSQFGRVAGLTVAPDGALLVTDDSNGVIYRIAYSQ